MTTAPGSAPPDRRRLRLAVVLAATEEACTVVAAGRREALTYAAPFPRPRASRVAPGHLVAVAEHPDAGSGRAGLVVWRWFDAVVIERTGTAVGLWEPNHGLVVAEPRDPRRAYRPGSRAYLSAGLPGADWWVAGPATGAAEDADVDLADVEQLFTTHGLWGHLD